MNQNAHVRFGAKIEKTTFNSIFYPLKNGKLLKDSSKKTESVRTFNSSKF